MLVAPSADGVTHLVSRNETTLENPRGFDRLIGGSVEFGETHREAIIREVDEELGAQIRQLTFLGVVENIFEFNGEPGHELVALYSGTLEPEVPREGGTLTESNGDRIPVVWREIDDADIDIPLYPAVATTWIREAVAAVTAQ